MSQVQVMFRLLFSAFRTGEAVEDASRPARRAHSRARVRLLFGAGALISLFSAVPSSAKTTSRKAKVAVSGVSSFQSISTLGPDDVISVTVLRHPESSNESLTIPSSGQINLPGAGAVRVAGLTPTQAASRIARALSQELLAPEVTVELKQAHPRRVFVSGAVAKTGTYDIQPGWRISEVLTASGGVSGRSDEVAGTLTRAGLPPVRINLKAIQSNPSSSANLRLREGDNLSFRALDVKLITVSGDVQRPGKYPLRNVPRLLEAITLAGQLKGRADETTATLTRAGRLSALDVQAVQDNPTSPKNIVLKAGDILFFTARDPKTIMVSGDVEKPGKYPLRSAPRLLDAITLAGRLKGRADETTATLTRAGNAPTVLDVEAIQDNPASPKNLILKAGDVLSFQLRDPKVVTVSGSVNKPDLYPLRRARRLQDAINAANGLKEDVSQTRGFLFRGVQKIQLDLVAAQTLNTREANIELQNGDRLEFESIPKLLITVNAPTTFVRNPGSMQLPPDSGVAQAVAQAGLTVLPEEVVATVLRGRQIISIDLKRAGIDPMANFALQSGDVVNISEPNVIRIQVGGAVNKQGALRIAPGSTLLDALNRGAGGITSSLQPDEVRIFVVRTRSRGASLVSLSTSNEAPGVPNALDGATANGATAPGASEVAAPRTQVVGDGESISVNAVALLRDNDLRQNITLQDGDLVSVTQVKNPTVVVSGQVGKTGPYQITEGEGIAQLLARAGGTTDAAALTRVVLQRGNESRTLNVYNEVKGGPKTVVLQDGDTVFVPENTARVTLINAVVKPGPIAIPENHTLTVTEAINAAGGPRDRGIKEVGLLRPNPAFPGGVERRIVSLAKIYKGDLSENVVLRPGDFIYVPDAKAPRAGLLGILGQTIGTLTGLRYLTG